MGCLGDVDSPNDRSITNTNDEFTQVFDSQFSPPPSLGEKVEDDNNEQLHFLDTLPVEDAYETQEVNLDYETQALNLGETQTLYLGDETQALDLGCETQALEYFEDFENMETQFLDVFDNAVVNDTDNEGSDRTEVMGDAEGMSDDDSARRGCGQSLEKEKVQCTSTGEQREKDLREQCEISNLGSLDSSATPVFQGTQQSEPRSVPRFTSIRAASLRASGLSARSMALKEIDSKSCYVPSGDLFSDEDALRKDGLKAKVIDEIDSIQDLKNNEKEQGLRNGNICMLGSSTVKELFYEDSASEDKGLPHNSDNTDRGENLLNSSVNDGELAGLSYVDSQEPGELSQAKALIFVEKFLEKNNFMEFDDEVGCGKSTGGKSKPVSIAKGPQSLAKKCNYRGTAGETGIYDWDDRREDEGGGEIFCRRKDEFFGSGCHMQRSLTEPKNLKKRKLELYRDDAEHTDALDSNVMQSDSIVALENIKNNEKKAQEPQLKLEKNLLNDFDEQLNANSSRGQPENAPCMADVPHMLDVGPDTQLAAEAMEALLSGDGTANHEVNGMQRISNRSTEGSSRGKTKSRVSKQSPSQKRACLSGVGVATRQYMKTKGGTELSKRSPVSSVKNFKNSRKKCDRKPVITKKRRGKSMTEQNPITNGAQMRLEKNLLNELDEQINADSSRGQPEAAVSKSDVPHMLDVGPDTQLAAEAMEALLSGDGTANHDVNGMQSNSNHSAEGSSIGKTKSRVSKLSLSQKRVCLSGVGVVTRQNKKTKSGTDLRKCSPVSSVKNFKNSRKKCDRKPEITKKRRANSMAEQNSFTNGRENVDKASSEIIGHRNEEGDLYSCRPKELNRFLGTATRNAGHSIKKAESPSTSTPIACRTRHSLSVNRLKTAEQELDNCAKDTNHLMDVGTLEEIGTGSIDVEASEVLHVKRKYSKLISNPCLELENPKRSQPEKLDLELTSMNNGIDALTHHRGRRSCRNLSDQVRGCNKLVAQPNNSVQPEGIGLSFTGNKRSRSIARSTHFDLTMKRKTRSSVHACAVSPSLDRSLEGKVSEKNLNKPDFVGVTAVNQSEKLSIIDPQPSAENAEMDSMLDKSPRGRCKATGSACTSPENCTTPVNAASPVCMGNEYFKQTCKKNLSKSCLKEIRQLISTEPEPISPLKDLRKRRDVASIRVLFSHHLDEDIIKQQKKILERLGASEATSISDATHFVTDKFVRTRNMLEAIASGKPVVTHLWLESMAQVKIHIDEESYLLRDTKKEKEFGFSMPTSLAHARKHPLLQGRKVLITPNVKPSKETVSSLVKAVHGQAVERMGRSALKDDEVPVDLLILSCDEDYEICERFLEKGAAVYSSELLLNGIVTQKLQYERHHLFMDHVKRTRSTIWLKKNGRKFHPVTKLK